MSLELRRRVLLLLNVPYFSYHDLPYVVVLLYEQSMSLSANAAVKALHSAAMASNVFVLCQGEVPVTTGAGEPVAPSAAGAVRIRRDGQTCTVLFSWQAGAHEAGLLCAGGCEAHGCTAVFTPQHPQGLCLD